MIGRLWVALGLCQGMKAWLEVCDWPKVAQRFLQVSLEAANPVCREPISLYYPKHHVKRGYPTTDGVSIMFPANRYRLPLSCSGAREPFNPTGKADGWQSFVCHQRRPSRFRLVRRTYDAPPWWFSELRKSR